MKFLTLIALLLSFSSFGPAVAQPGSQPAATNGKNGMPVAPNREGCQTGTPEGEEACLTPDLKEIESALDRQQQQLQRQLKTAERTVKTAAATRLRTSQTRWKQYRESQCALEGLAAAGTSEWLKVRTLECKMRMTKDRLEALRDIEASLE